MYDILFCICFPFYLFFFLRLLITIVSFSELLPSLTLPSAAPAPRVVTAMSLAVVEHCAWHWVRPWTRQMCCSDGASGWWRRDREAAERALTALPRAAVPSLLSLLPSSQDEANLPSRLLPCCPDTGTSPCSYPWTQGRYSKKDFTKPDKVQE